MTKKVIGFDLDGVLIDTREANYRAYDAVGIHMPHDAFGKSASEWVTDWEAYKEKQRIYPNFINKYAKPLSGYATLLDIYAAPSFIPVVITKASQAGASAALSALPHFPDILVKFAGTAEHKVKYLKERNARAWVDDTIEEGEYIAMTAGCIFFPYYNDLDGREFSNRICHECLSTTP